MILIHGLAAEWLQVLLAHAWQQGVLPRRVGAIQQPLAHVDAPLARAELVALPLAASDMHPHHSCH
jgi:hypothetical protein